jgi:hypothetical protein
MSRSRSLRRLWRHPYVFVAAAILFACGLATVGGTFASWSSQTENRTGTFAAGWVGPATNLTFSPSGSDAGLFWTPGTHGPVTGQTLYGLDNGSSSSCPANGYSNIAAMPSTSTTTYTDAHGSSTTLSDKVGVTTLKTALPTPTTINMVGGINNAATSLTVTSSTGMPAAPFVVQVDSEDMNVTAKAGNVLTVARGFNGTTAASHTNGTSVYVATVLPTAFASFPSTNGFTFLIGSEQMTVTAGAGTATWTVTRGDNGTTAAAHAALAPLNQVSMTVASSSNFPSSGNYVILVGTEQMHVTSGQGTTSWLVTRPYNGSTAAAHASAATVSLLSAPYWCYEMANASSSSWTATASFPAGQAGLVATGLAIHEATIGTLTTGDTIVVTYNQKPSLTGVFTNSKVCALVDGSSNITIYLKYGACVAGGSTTGEVKLTGLTGTTVNKAGNVNLSVVMSSTAPWTVTYTVGGSLAATTGTISGTATALVDSTVKSAAVTDQSVVCTDSDYGCLPTATQTH